MSPATIVTVDSPVGVPAIAVQGEISIIEYPDMVLSPSKLLRLVNHIFTIEL